MRLSRAASVAERSKGKKLGNSRVRKKHKRLDAICEKAYNENHRRIGAESSKSNGGSGAAANESELRRSTRTRRAPSVLDASPLPPKKRRKIAKKTGIGSVYRVNKEDEGDTPCSSSKGLEDESWRARLRSRSHMMRFGAREKASPRSKRSLFEDLDEFKDSKLPDGEFSEKKEDLEGGQPTVVRSKRPGRIKASNIAINIHQEMQPDGSTEIDKEKNEVDVFEGKDMEDVSPLNEMGCANNSIVEDCNVATELIQNVENDVHTVPCLSESPENDILGAKQQDEQAAEPGCMVDDQGAAPQVDRVSSIPENGERCYDIPFQDDILTNKANNFVDEQQKLHMKEGRRCGLCGGGTDGKPPKILVQDGTGSDNETYSGSSVSEEPNYDIWDGFGDEAGWLGRLLGPINDRFGIARIWVHQHCAVWSPEVYFAGLGHLKNVRAALCRGRVLKCSRCGRRGATIGCRVDRCPKTYHLPCARTSGCIFDHRKFLIACTDHRHIFQPHGSKYLSWIKKLKARKMKLETRKASHEAWRKDIEAEEKWLEICGEDEEFLKRESKRLHRDLLRIAPVYIGASASEVQYQGWESVAGLQNVIQCMKEVVILPLLYPDLFNNLGLTPPRGVLLHGYPGTGKTLVVRALIGSCARGDKRIAYFARKGADCLGKYVGDAERQLRLLFQVAEKSQPSIIFFDEIDGLAPCRTRQQDQTHNSVVSTLLALLDGLKSRGSVVVIGATNRPDAVDPALRRPGRFDREIYFPLPSVKDREAILSLHTKNWPKPVTGPLLKWIAKRTIGFAGADLQALCTQAAIIAVKRGCPLQELLSIAGRKGCDQKCASLPNFTVKDRDWLEALSCAPPPCSRREAGIAASNVVSSPLPVHLASYLLRPLSVLLLSLYLDERLLLPSSLSKAALIVKSIVFSALDKNKMPSDCWWIHIHDLLRKTDVLSEIEARLSCSSDLIGGSSFVSCDALEGDTNNDTVKQGIVSQCNLQPKLSCASGKRSGFRILISGNRRSGQRHLASCLLNCFGGTVEVQKIDLATMSQEEHGDMVQGLTQLLIRCASLGSCMVFMPRIDLWATDTSCQVRSEELDASAEVPEMTEGNNCSPRECKSMMMIDSQEAGHSASHVWSSFIEQVETISVSSSLMILATSEVPFPELPLKVRQFFQSDASDCSTKNPWNGTVSRFSVQVDGHVNRDMVIASSAAKLAKDLAWHFIHVIYPRMHVQAIHKKNKDSDIVKCNGSAAGPGMGHVSSIEGNKKDCIVGSIASVPHTPNKILKGKSSLPLVISSFGYQILRYPHFAELCWVTSKLKEGPAADVNGSLNCWRFNSCIVRPNILLEKLAFACSSDNVRCKEKSVSVRGLVAVGLMAYKGLYTSLKEVSHGVQKVLDLLAQQINAKVQAGKDRRQYFRLLSQMAYLKDLVSSWAYTLKSLEVDAHSTEEKSKPTSLELPSSSTGRDGDVFQADGLKAIHPSRSPLELELMEKEPRIFDATNAACVIEDGADFGNLGSAGLGSPVLVERSEEIVSLHASQVTASGADLFDGKLLNEQHLVDSAPFGSQDVSNNTVTRHPSHSAGLACEEYTILREDDGSGDLVGDQLYSTQEDFNQCNGFSSSGFTLSGDGLIGSNMHDASINLTSKGTNSPPDYGGLCAFKCCSHCLSNLQELMQQILMREWDFECSEWTVEDVHEVVSTLSVKLHSALGDSLANSFNTNLTGDTWKCWSGSRCSCQDERSGNEDIQGTDCSCHLGSKGTANARSSLYRQHSLDVEAIFKDGILVAFVDSDTENSFHCKFETLCLCSLTQCIVKKMQPLD